MIINPVLPGFIFRRHGGVPGDIEGMGHIPGGQGNTVKPKADDQKDLNTAANDFEEENRMSTVVNSDQLRDAINDGARIISRLCRNSR